MPKTPAVAYLRTSSATNVGDDKDSDRRQRDAVRRYARAAGLEIVHEVHDVVTGEDRIEDRPGFATLLDYVEAHQVGIVLVEDASRFARALIAQELGVLALAERGLRVVTASGQDLTDTDDPTKVLMRQIAGAFAQYEKARLVAKLKTARDRRSRELGRRVEGRRGYADTAPELVRAARRLSRKEMSLREIAAALAVRGWTTSTGKLFSAGQVARLLAKKTRRRATVE